MNAAQEITLPAVVTESAAAAATGQTVDHLRELWMAGRFPCPVGFFDGEALFEPADVERYRTAHQK